MKEASENKAIGPFRRRGLIVAAAVAALLAVLAGVYGIGGLQRNAGADAGDRKSVV